MTHPDTTTLNEYVDDLPGAAERAEVARHLEACAACRGLVADLRGLKRTASALGPIAPPSRVWPRIERAIERPEGGAEPSRNLRRSGRWWAGLAAAAALAVAVAGGLIVSRQRTPAPTGAAAVESELAQAEAHYENAIRGLEQITTSGEAALDPATAATLERNLAVIDQAIAESRAAVRAQPTSEPAEVSLLESFKAKLAFLEDTVALINEARKGNGAAAARIASRMNKG